MKLSRLLVASSMLIGATQVQARVEVQVDSDSDDALARLGDVVSSVLVVCLVTAVWLVESFVGAMSLLT